MSSRGRGALFATLGIAALLCAGGLAFFVFFLGPEPGPAPPGGVPPVAGGGHGTDVHGDPDPDPADPRPDDPVVPVPDPPRPVDPVPDGDPGVNALTRLSGDVTDRKDAPIEAARVSIALESGGRLTPIARTRTDAKGHYSVGLLAVDELSTAELDLARLVVQAVADGYQASTKGLDPTSADPGALELDLSLFSGATVTGRVVRAGAGVPGAEVELVVEQGDGWHPVLQVEAGVDGTFAIGFTSSGRYRVHARHPELGAAASDVVKLAAGKGRALGDLALSGGGSIAGRVVHPDGSAAPGATVRAIPEAFEGPPTVGSLKRAAKANGEAAGLYWGETRADEAGGFRLEGLASGRYVLSLPDVEGADEATHATGTTNAELVLEGHRLRVRVVDGARHPLTGTQVTLVETLAGGGKQSDARRHDQKPAVGENAEAIFFVEPGATYVVGARLEGCAPAEENGALGYSEFERTVELMLVPSEGRGRLRVNLWGPQGDPIESYAVRLRSPVTRMMIEGLQKLEPGPDGQLPAIPAGDYLVTVIPDASSRDPILYFPVQAERTVSIVADRETVVDFEASLGARLRITLDVVSAPPGFPPVMPPDLDEDGRTRWDRRVLEQYGARVGVRTPLAQKFSQLGFVQASESGWTVVAHLLPGNGALTDPLLEPGSYEVEVRAPGFELARERVELHPGEIRELRIALERER